MNVTQNTNDEQTSLWNGLAGRAWVDAQEFLDQMFKPLENLLADAVVAYGSATGPRRRLRYGQHNARCRTAARRGGPLRRHRHLRSDAHLARARAQQEGTAASFIVANAQTHPFEPASFDVIISRFGVMFFDDSVRAFANLRSAASDDAELRFIVWRSAAENPFMTTAERAAAPLLPNLPARRPGAPGQFAFADKDRVCGILEESGWAGITIRPIDVTCTFPEKELGHYATRLGPLGQILHQSDDRTRVEVTEKVRAAFDFYVHGAEVRFTAACWMVSARA